MHSASTFIVDHPVPTELIQNDIYIQKGKKQNHKQTSMYDDVGKPYMLEFRRGPPPELARLIA